MKRNLEFTEKILRKMHFFASPAFSYKILLWFYHEHYEFHITNTWSLFVVASIVQWYGFAFVCQRSPERSPMEPKWFFNPFLSIFNLLGVRILVKMADFWRDLALTLTPFPGPEFDSNEPQLSECCRKLAEHVQKQLFYTSIY